MDVATPAVQEFFDQYADSSMFAGPDGVWVADKQAILAGFPKALELLKTVGHTTTGAANTRRVAGAGMILLNVR